MNETFIVDGARPIRLMTRHLVEYLLAAGARWAAFAGVDQLDGLLARTAFGANVAALPFRDDEGWHGLDSPAALLRPISSSALAQSLALPAETVRVRTKALIEAGVLARVRSGLIATPIQEKPGFAAFAGGEAEAIRCLAATIAREAYESSESVARAVAALGALPAMVTARLALDFDMRCAESFIAVHGSMQSGIVLTALVAANVRDIVNDLKLSKRYATVDRPPPDALRTPITARALAREIGMPPETVRRQLHALQARGFVQQRGDAGWFAPGERLMGEDFTRNNDRNARHFLRLLGHAAKLNAPPTH